MSTQALSWVFDESKTDGVTRLVMIGIANHVDRRGDGWAYVDEVLRVARCSLKSYHRAVQAAVEMGELTVELRQGGRLDMRGGHRPNLYVFPRMTAASCGGQPGEDTSSCGGQPDQDRPGQPGGVGGGQPDQDTSTPLRNDPSMTRQGAVTDGGQAHPASSAETLDGMPLTKTAGLTYAETLARWLGCSADLPVKARRDESYAMIIRQVDCHVPSKHPKRRGVFLGILRDYVTDVCEAPLNAEASKHLSRIFSTFGPQLALRGLTLAVLHGAGLGDEWEADPKALTKYAHAVLAREAVMA